MDKQRQTAGETAKTKPAWGVVSIIGMAAACTIEGSFIVTAIAVALFGLGAWLGGYMKGGAQ